MIRPDRATRSAGRPDTSYKLVLQELVAFALKMDLVVPPIELADATAEIDVR